LMRRAARVDDNHAAIAAALRQTGCTVLSLAPIGQGCPDLLVGRGGTWGMNLLLEIKDGDKSPSRRELTPDQETFLHSWNGPIAVVTSLEEALAAVQRHLGRLR
jgi:hypothetical protein